MVPGKTRGSELWKLDQSARHAPHFLRGIGPDDNVNLIHYRICYRPDHISQRSSVIPHRCVKDTVCVWLHPSRESVFHDLERGLHLARIIDRHPSLLFDTKRLFVSRLRGLKLERMGVKRRLIAMGSASVMGLEDHRPHLLEELFFRMIVEQVVCSSRYLRFRRLSLLG